MLREGRGNPIRVSKICNPRRGLPSPGCCKSWTRGWDSLIDYFSPTVKTAMGDLWGRRPPLIADRKTHARMRFVLKNTRRRQPPVKRDRRPPYRDQIFQIVVTSRSSQNYRIFLPLTENNNCEISFNRFNCVHIQGHLKKTYLGQNPTSTSLW